MNLFSYENVEVKSNGKMKTIRKVSVKNGKGYKSIIKYKNGKKISSVKKPIHLEHMEMIHGGQFIPGLFKDCKGCKTRKNSKTQKNE